MKIAILSITALVCGMVTGGIAAGFHSHESIQTTHHGSNHSLANNDSSVGTACQPKVTPEERPAVTLTEDELARYQFELERLDFERRLEEAADRSNIDKPPPLPDPEAFNETTVSAEWARTHAQNLYDTFDRWASKETAWGMRDAVGKNSAFIRPREKVMDDATDENWALVKQQELRDIMQANSRASEFELVSLTCKQLMCEIVGSTRSIDVWRGIFRDLLVQAKNIAPSNDEEGDMVGLFNDDGIRRVYTLCRFSK